MVVMAGAVYFFKKQDEVLFSACWFLLFLLPVINIIPLHTMSLMADRYAYFSLMGFALCLATVISRVNGRGAIAAAVTLCAVYACIDFSRNSIWQNEIVFFTRMTKDAPERFAGFKNLGMAYYRKGEKTPALHNLEVADSKPDISYKYLAGDAYILWKENRPEQAEKALLRARELEPGNPEPYIMLMLMHEQQGNTPQAWVYRSKAEELVRNIDQVMVSRAIELCRAGEAYLSKQLYSDAEIFFWQALQINPVYIPALIDMGSMKAVQGDYANAAQYLNRALTVDPVNATAHFNLSMVYKIQGRFADAQAEMIKSKEAEAVAKQKGGVSGP
jgi:tetratricopeptide (TPR) repeat protein